MPTWKDLLTEVSTAGSVYDVVRRKYLTQYHEFTGRNAIIYYDGWLQKSALVGQGYTGFSVNDTDKNGFMAAIHQLDRSKGLDLFLHTPGGDTAATESLVDYLRSMFGTNIRAIVPQIAMSAGTLIALASREIVMGKHSSLGPIDPQIGGIAAHGVIEEFAHASEQIKAEPETIPLWQLIINKYPPTLIGSCQKAIDWCELLAKEWLVSGMFDGDPDAENKADKVVNELGSHAITKSHARHISIGKAREVGLHVKALEDDQDFQDAALSVHHAAIQTLSATPACKIIENHLGMASIETFSRT